MFPPSIRGLATSLSLGIVSYRPDDVNFAPVSQCRREAELTTVDQRPAAVSISRNAQALVL